MTNLNTEWINSEIEKIKYTYRLNRVIRYNLNRNEEKMPTQSVSEHVFNMIILAYYFRELEDPDKKLNFEKVIKIILMHDLGEIETGDIVMSRKSKSDGKKETEAINIVAEKSPNFISIDINNLFEEYENSISPEAKYVKSIDKIEAQFWFSAVCENLEMIKTVSTVVERIANEDKRRKIYTAMGYKIIEKFGKILDDNATKNGLYK